MHSVTLLLLHTSFIVILTGALITHLFAIKGLVHIRKGSNDKSIYSEQWQRNKNSAIQHTSKQF